MAPDISALREQIGARLPRVATELQALVRNSIRIKTLPLKNEALLPPGTSKLGGLPDLPEDVGWPEWNGKALAFIAQFNLEEVAPFELERLLPATGMLYFFYDAQMETWGDTLEDRGGARVLYYSGDMARIRRTPFPETLHEWGRDYPACRLELASVLSMPSSDSMYVESLDLTEEEVAAYNQLEEWLAGSNEDSADHRLLGYPSAIQQDDMEELCALVTGGIYVGSAEGYESKKAEELKKTAADWLLLLQVDSDNNAMMMWGDAGMIYYWIKSGDLAQRNFDGTWLVLQCY
ncbi:MAG: YwqG family protein [Chloroflexota bacterium]|nr:YwqG family protein [Chloroflexota bacterium]MDQ5864919.1 YwqG family protein [Chloroflexota bacterium]